jgi:putative hydroxymethylpyrimidine transport system permease protein
MTREREPAPPLARRRGRRSARGAVGRYWPPVLITLGAIGLWQLLVWLLDTPTYLFPSPWKVALALESDHSLLLSAAWVTTKEIALGFLLSLAAGILLAVVLHISRPLRQGFYPILIGSQTIPVVVLAPVLVILLGYGIAPKLAIVALICFFPIVVNGIDGLGSVDSEYARMMTTLDASRWSIFRRVEFPAALPSLFTGMRIAATFAAIGAVFGEWAGSNSGLGYVMLAATPNLQTERVFAAIVILTVIALALFALVSLAERLLIPWAR